MTANWVNPNNPTDSLLDYARLPLLISALRQAFNIYRWMQWMMDTKPIPACHTTNRNALNILDSTNSQKAAIFDTAVEFSRILHNQLWVPQLSIYKGLNVRFLSTTGKIGRTSKLSKQSWFLTMCEWKSSQGAIS